MDMERAARLFERGVIHGVEYARALHNHGATASAKQLVRRTVREWFVCGISDLYFGEEAVKLGIRCFTASQDAILDLLLCGINDAPSMWDGGRQEFKEAQLPAPANLREVKARLKAYQLWLACGGLERALC